MKLSPYVFQLHATLRTLRLWKRNDSSGTSATSSGNAPSHSCSGGVLRSRHTKTMPRHEATWIGCQVHALGHVGTEVAGVQQLAVGAERPAVISTHQVGLMTLAVPHDRAGAVRAHVVEPHQARRPRCGGRRSASRRGSRRRSRRCGAVGGRRRCAPTPIRRSASAPARRRRGRCTNAPEGSAPIPLAAAYCSGGFGLACTCSCCSAIRSRI